MPSPSTLPENSSLLRRGLLATGRIIRQWFDTDYMPDTERFNGEDRFDVRRATPYILLHIGCLAVFWTGWSWFAVAAAAFLYFIRMFAITAFYHRYFSHKAFRTSRAAQFVFAVMGNSSMQRGPLWWVATHRHHHAHSDLEGDKHSPVQDGFVWSHVGWLTSSNNFPTNYKSIPDLAKYRELVFLNRHDFVVPLIYLVSLWGLGALLEKYAPGLNTNGAQLFVWGGFISTAFLLQATLFINSLAHVFGKRRFKTTDDSRNSLPLAVVTLGEGWHNNHHRYAHSARQGFYWWELDISYYLLKCLSWMGIIWDLRGVPKHIYEEAAPGSAKS
ncbi:MAG: acyl-CoA desaturase [Verrucomicrobiales bacterium]